MIFANTKRLLTLWIVGFIGAFTLHIALGAQFYFYGTGVSNNILSPTVTLTFVQESLYSDAETDLLNIDTDLSYDSTERKELKPDFLEQESETLETANEIQPEKPSHIVEEDDFAVLKSLKKPLPKKVAHEASVKKRIPMPKAAIKQPTIKSVRSSVTAQGGDTAALEDALLVKWLAKVQAQLEMQKNYIVGQRISHAKGTVKLEFRVHEQGSIFSSRIIVSAGDMELDQLAMAVLQRVGSFPPPPPSKVNKIIRVSLIFS